jgi:hypothetical protein
MTLVFTSGAVVVGVEARTRHFREAVRAAAGGPDVLQSPGRPDVILVEGTTRERSAAAAPVSRGVTRETDGAVVFDSAGGSGYRQRWQLSDHLLRVESTWAPSVKEAAAARALPARFRALRGQVLLQYPVLWRASLQGLVPMHVSTVVVAGTAVVLAGPGGVGKTSLVTREVAAGGRAACDNLAVTDGTVLYGVREPLRVPAGGRDIVGPRALHGRREVSWQPAGAAVRPDVVVVVRRDGATPRIRGLAPDEAHLALVAGTMAAGELMRYWPTAAILGLATGAGPALPPIDTVARALVDRLPCYELQLGPIPGATLRSLVASVVGAAGSEVAG